MEKQDLIVADEQMNADLEAFRLQFNVDVERFKKGFEFCEKVLEGGVKSKVYAEVFDVSMEKAQRTSSQFHRTKWVQELLLFLRPNEHSLYFGERKRIIQAGMNIIDDPRASNRDKTEAMKALQPFIKAEIAQNELDDAPDAIGNLIAKGITDQVAELAKRGKMVNEKGDIIDVVLID